MKSSDMLSRLADVEKTFPSQICYASVQPATRTKPRSGVEIYVVTRIYLESLRCYFVLEKLKLSRSWASGQKVLNIAQEMMNAVLSFWLNRDQLQQHQAAFDWLVSPVLFYVSPRLCFRANIARLYATVFPAQEFSASSSSNPPNRHQIVILHHSSSPAPM